MLKDKSETVKVVVRARPLSDLEMKNGNQWYLMFFNLPTIIV